MIPILGHGDQNKSPSKYIKAFFLKFKCYFTFKLNVHCDSEVTESRLMPPLPKISPQHFCPANSLAPSSPSKGSSSPSSPTP